MGLCPADNYLGNEYNNYEGNSDGAATAPEFRVPLIGGPRDVQKKLTKTKTGGGCCDENDCMGVLRRAMAENGDAVLRNRGRSP